MASSFLDSLEPLPAPGRAAREIPLAHGVPEGRISTWSPSLGRLIAGVTRGAAAGRVCFYLGPLRRRTTKYPAVAFLLRADVEGANWYAFPCDAGGTGLSADRLDEWKMLAGRWRSYLDRFVGLAFGGSWNAYVRAAEPPALEGLPEGLRAIVRPRRAGNDAAGWTPEVCSPADVPLGDQSVAAVAVLEPVLAKMPRFTEFVQELGELCALGPDVVAATAGETPRELLVAWSQRAVETFLATVPPEAAP